MDQNFNEREWTDAVDVYSQYFRAQCEYGGSMRKAAIVKLTALKDANGVLAYEASASFMPFEDEEDFRVPDDNRVSRIVSSGSKRRMRRNEEKLLSALREEIDSLITEMDGNARIDWDQPLREARLF